MTFQKVTAKTLQCSSLHEANGKTTEKKKTVKKLLNSESTLQNRVCQTELASVARIKSSIRKDVTQTTDTEAFGDMFEYIKSDVNTLDTHKDSKIASFYKGRSVLITGASGFVGKVGIIKNKISLLMLVLKTNKRASYPHNPLVPARKTFEIMS